MDSSKMSLFVGRLNSNVRTKDLQDLFSHYGTLKRCDIKGSFAFVTFEDERDAEDALKECNGKEVSGAKINVEWAKGSGRYEGTAGRDSRGGGDRGGGGGRDRDDKCFLCGERGHFARDCRNKRTGSSGGYRSSRRGGRSRSRSRSPRGRRSRSRSRSPRKRRSSRSPRRHKSRSKSKSPDKKKTKRSHSRSKSPDAKTDKKRSKSHSRSRSRSKSKDGKEKDNGKDSPKRRERSSSPVAVKPRDKSPVQD